jgi:predicted enzyme related to lactoylglutathione lyase
MIESIGRTTILVRDQDEALNFYTQVFGFDVIADMTLENGFRALHVGPRGSATGFWLMPAHGEGTQLVGAQTAGEPLAVLYTGNCQVTAIELYARGAELRVPVTKTPTSVYAHVADLYGNEFVLVELIAER